MTKAENYQAILEAVAGARFRLPAIGMFDTHEGSHWNHELMVCGRAVNGMDSANEVTPQTLMSPATRNEWVNRFLMNEGSMDWVAKWFRNPKVKYNTARSAFWRVTYRVGERVGAFGEESDWSEALVWTNLYRIAPLETGNPSAKLRSLQIDSCKSLFRDDLERLKPRRLLLLSGSNWANPFLSESAIVWDNAATSLVQGRGHWTRKDGSTLAVVVARHPQGKPEVRFVNDVVEAFSELAATNR